MTDFTNIRTALDNLLTVIDNTAAELIGTANEQRKELLSLYGRMQATQADLHELGAIVGEAGSAMLDVEEICEDVGAKMQSVLEGGIDETPVCNFEAFVGFCSNCGDEIVSGEEYSLDEDNGVVCADCLDTEQISIDLAETANA